MNIRTCIGFLFLISLLCSTAASAQQNSTQTSQAEPQATTTQRHSDKMYLDVVVSQKSGPPIAGLQQQDFTLLDNKSQQPIRSFKAVTGREAPIEVVLVIDAINADARTIAYERGQIERFLNSEGGHLAYPTVLAVATERGTQVLGTFSNDGNALKTELDKDEIGLRVIGRDAGFYGAADRLQMSLKALHQLVVSEGARPGRKAMIWISPGWPILSGPNVELDSKQENQVFAEVVDVSNQLAQARVTIYCVDPLGDSESLYRASYYEEFLKGVSKPSQVNMGNLGLQVLAIQSGGLTLNFNNDLPGLLQKSFSDMAPYYEISFEPAAAERPDEYHHFEVKIAKPGLTARARQGYYAQPAQHN